MSDGTVPRTRYIFFALAALGLLMASIDATIVAVAIPSLTSSLDTSLVWVGWTLTGYQLVQIVVMPLAGKLSDELGRKRVFMFCLGSFTIGSLLCGLAPNIGFLILFRALQAIGGGGLMPSAVGIVSDQFKERRSQAIGLFTSVFPIGGILGPTLGGWILENWSWREIFFINVPIGIAILIGVHLLLSDRRQDARPQRIDFPGVALFASAMVAFMYAMTIAGTDAGAWKSPSSWVLVICAVMLFALFIRQERRAAQPMVEMRLLASMPFLPANIYNFIFGACVFGLFSFVPYFAVVQYQMGAAQSGVVLTPRAVGMMVMSTVTSLLMRRIGYRIPMIAGMLMVGAGTLLLSFGWNQVIIGPLEFDGFWLMALEVALTGVGVGMAAPAANNAVIDLVPSRAAAITGLRGMFRMTGGIVGVSSVVLALSFFDDKAAGMRAVFFVLALLLQVAIPLTLIIPDTGRVRRRVVVAAPSATTSADSQVAIDSQVD